MPLDVPPWVLAPEFVWQGYRFPGAGPNRRFLTADNSRVALLFSNMAGTIQVAPAQQNLTSGGVIAIPPTAAPYLIHFTDVGGLICSEWWDLGVVQFDVIEIKWRPTPKGRR